MTKTIRYLHRIIFYFIFILLACKASGQVEVSGKILDNDTKLPLQLASVTDRSNSSGTLSDENGNYHLQINLGDWVIFSFIGYSPDSAQVTYAIRDSAIVMVYLRKSDFNLSQVEIKGKSIDYERDSAQRRYLFGNTMDQEKTKGIGAVMHPISGLYDLLSKKQRRIWKFQKMFNAYEDQQYILSRIKLSVVQSLTGLEGDELERFLGWYKPDYEFVRNATDYELYEDIKAASIDYKELRSRDSIIAPDGN